MKIHMLSMIRNEADIIEPFVYQATNLFDKTVIVDVTSTDGMAEYLQDTARRCKNIVVYRCATKERYQSAMMNALARTAIRESADWIFFLDADEYMLVKDRRELEDYLSAFPQMVMHMPWINLVPSIYSDFPSFDWRQTFRWTGRASTFNKIAVSSLYFHNYPEAYIAEGNHNISRFGNSECEPVSLGLPLLHVPVRSRDRLVYKLTNGLRLLKSKHNTQQLEGSHAFDIMRSLDADGGGSQTLNRIAAFYGCNEAQMRPVDPLAESWPELTLPIASAERGESLVRGRSVGETLAADAEVKWENPGFVKDCAVTARVKDDEVRIVAQPIKGTLERFYGTYEALPPMNRNIEANLTPDLLPMLLSDVIGASLTPVGFATFSAWSRLIPVLFALYPVLKPRRYVELGVHNGMSFFASCQIAQATQTETQCVAVDSWVGDPHASFHEKSVFDEFRSNCEKLYPNAHFIQGMFSHALECFEDESIDLLHIDGYHSYDAVRNDFETWLPKMSANGVVIFHDINVHERNFGVWQFWLELRERFPALSFMHSHGLGLLYVGSEENVISALFRWFDRHPKYFGVAQKYFEAVGELAIDNKVKTDTVDALKTLDKEKDAKINEFSGYLAHRDQQIKELTSNRWDPNEATLLQKALKISRSHLRLHRTLLFFRKSRRRRYLQQIALTEKMMRELQGSTGAE